uniref:Uncharacterized protein n=1 Tax=Kalanchoe fedtschenkoi TaxID=63787 RepID=A0A7N0VET3_KALFE
MAILASKTAKFWPMQILGPQENGINLTWPWVALDSPSENLSGLNSLASSPQSSGSLTFCAKCKLV